MKRLAVILLLVALAASGAEALTENEAILYVADDPGSAALDLVDWYSVLAAVPVITTPEAMAVVTDHDVAVKYFGPIDVSVAGGKLAYSVKMPELTFKGIVPHETPWWVWPMVIVTGAAGFASGWFMHAAISR